MNLSEIVARFAGLRIAVIGDAIIDMYHFGRCDRISPEAPVPVFVEDYDDPRGGGRRGGADNVAHQLEAFGCEVVTAFPPKRSVKHRYMVNHHCVFRRDSDQIADKDWFKEFDSIEGWDALVLSDYAKGALTFELCQMAANTHFRLQIPVIVDPKGTDWRKYSGCTVICPNQAEYAAVRHVVSADILEKRGEDGITLHYRDGAPRVHIPARSRHVFDVIGAGDAVVATVAATLAAGGTLEQAAELACTVAGWVVGEIGTAVCPLKYLEDQCVSSLPAESSTASTKDTSISSRARGS